MDRDGTPLPSLVAFRRRVVRSAALLLAAGHLVLTVLFVLGQRMSPIAVAAMLAAVALHAVAWRGVGRWWEPGDRWSPAYLGAMGLLVFLGVRDAASPATDGAWFALVPVGLAGVMYGGVRLALALAGIGALLVSAFAFGPGVDPVVLVPRLAALGVFALALRTIMHRVELALTDAEEARADLAAQVAAERAVNDRLRELDELKDDFVSIASHELRTPLAVILGLSQTLSHRWERLEDEQRRDLAGRVESHARSLEGIVATLLDTARLQRGALEPRHEPVQVQALVGASMHRMAILLRDHRVQVHVDVLGDACVIGDRALLDRVLDNLLSNAARHTPPGTLVDVVAEQVGDEVRFAVADAGPGVRPEELDRLGQRFYRAGDPDARTRDGVGLGLALVSDVLDVLDSRLEVSSELGAGTTFAFRLPYAPPGWSAAEVVEQALELGQ